jgi:hypothetical protein
MTARRRGLGAIIDAQRAVAGEAPPGVGLAVVPDPAAARTPRHPARRRRQPQKPAPGGAWDRVLAAQVSAEDAPQDWEQFSVRLPAGLVTRLAARVVADKARTGNRRLARCHYAQAALGAIDRDPGKAAEAGMAWRRENRGTALRTVAGTRLHRDLAGRMHGLADQLQARAGSVRAWEVQAAAVAALLDALETAAAVPGKDQ